MLCDILLTLIGLVLSALIGLGTALMIENAKRSSLKIRRGGHFDHVREGLPMKSLHLIVQHTGVRGRSFRRFIHPSPALACSVRLRVLRENGVEALPAPYHARWTGSQQPPEFWVAGVGIPPSVFEMLSKRDVFPHTGEKIDVCIKYEGEDVCYIFNNASYAVSDFRMDAHRLTAGIYIVEATATSGDIVARRSFRLRNDFQLQNFRLEAI